MRSFESTEKLLLSVFPRGSVRLSLPHALSYSLRPLETPLSEGLPLYITFSFIESALSLKLSKISYLPSVTDRQPSYPRENLPISVH